MKKVAIANFNSIAPAAWEFLEKAVERFDEVPSAREIGRVKLRELEHQEPDVAAKGFAWLQKLAREKIDIQEMRIGLARTRAMAWKIGKRLDRNLIGDLEGEQKIR